MLNFKEFLTPYNPWWVNSTEAFSSLPPFHRPLFYILLDDLEKIPQMLSVTGPRRIGKSTLLFQLIAALRRKGVTAERLIYYSFDDPALIRRNVHGGDVLDQIMQTSAQGRPATRTYLFLDEIQRLERWELYLKKYYDQKFPVRVVISGSASSPIFKKSRESLLGRVKDYHALPFSFREFLLYRLQQETSLVQEAERLYERGQTAQGMLTGDPHVGVTHVKLQLPSEVLRQRIEAALGQYLLEGGFPEVWTLPDWGKKQEYLFDNQVKKVIYEDLLLAAEFRKPELLKRFYVSLLEQPGQETSVQAMAHETGTVALQIDKYLPLLEMTDLVYRVEKFRKSPLRVRRGKMKFYLVDLALRNAVLRLTETLLKDETILGLYAENLVFLALKKWRGTLQMDYYRERDGEVDFIVHIGSKGYLPVEVKYRERIDPSDLNGVRNFATKYAKRAMPIVVSKRWEQFGTRDGMFYLPLPLFLLLFD